MTIKMIELHHDFDKPGTKTGLTVDVGGEIKDGQGIVILRGLKPQYKEDKYYKFLQLKVKATNIKIQGRELVYDLEFDFKDDDGHVGSADIDLLLIADIDDNS